MYIYAYLWLFGRHTGGAADTLGVQRRQYNVIYLYSTLSNGPITIAIRVRIECDSSTIRLRGVRDAYDSSTIQHPTRSLQGVMRFRAIMNMSILLRCCTVL